MRTVLKHTSQWPFARTKLVDGITLLVPQHLVIYLDTLTFSSLAMGRVQRTPAIALNIYPDKLRPCSLSDSAVNWPSISGPSRDWRKKVKLRQMSDYKTGWKIK